MMKTLNILFVLFYLITSGLYAQETLEAFPKKSKDFTIKGVPGKGFLLGFDTGDKAYEIRKYDNDFNIVWKNQFKASETYFTSSPVIFSSAEGDYTYILSNTSVEGIVTYSSKDFIWRVNATGEVSKMDYKSLGKNWMLKEFAIGKTLYKLYQLNEKGVAIKDAPIGLEKINLESKTNEITKLKLAEQRVSTIGTGWKYSAHDSKNIYLNSRTFDLDNKQYECRIAILDTDGNLIKEIMIKGKTNECIYPASSLHTFPANSYGNVDDILYLDEYSVLPQAGGYANVLIDTANQSFYVYGLQGKCVGYETKPESELTGQAGIRPMLEGFTVNSIFIHKYNFEGKEVFKIEKELTPTFKKIWIPKLYREKYIAARMDNDNNFEMCPVSLVYGTAISIERIALHFIVSPDGKTVKTKEVKYARNDDRSIDIDEAYTILDTDDNVFITKSKPSEFNVYDTGKGKAVVRYDEKEKVTKLQVYKN